MNPTDGKCGICGEHRELVAHFSEYRICESCEREINGSEYIPPPPRLVKDERSFNGIIDASDVEN